MTNKESLQRRARDIYGHYPHELFISVNGYFLGSQKIVAGRAEQSVNVNIPEPISFVEIFSEQGIRLLMLDVQPLPEGAVQQSESVDLSDGRSLELELRFGGLWPELHIAYADATFTDEPAAVVAALAPRSSAPSIGSDIVGASPEIGFFGQMEAWFVRAGWAAWNGAMSHRSTFIAAIATMLFIVAAVFLKTTVKPVSAAVLLNRSSAMEKRLTSIPGRVLHRSIDLEERNHESGALISRKRIEVWRSTSKKGTARRLYSDQGKLEAGEWIKQDGLHTVLEQAGKERVNGESRSSAPFSFASIWRLSLSADEFSSIVPSPSQLKVEATPNAYVLHYAEVNSRQEFGVVEASLTLRSSDYHAVAQTLVVQQGSDVREYDFEEIRVEEAPTEMIADAIFEPDPALLGVTPVRPAIALPGLPAPLPLMHVASPELEVEVLQRLDQVNALAGEQVTVNHTPQGALAVEGIVETQERKTEILSALASLLPNPAIKLGINTVDEAEANQKQAPPERIRIEKIEVKERAVPVANDLRTYFAAQKEKKNWTSEQIDQEIRRYSEQIFNRSIRARLHASALNQIVTSFTPDQLDAMDQTARAQWRSMVNKHAQAFWGETEMLRQELEPIFQPEAAKSPVPPVLTKADGDLRPYAKQLLDAAVANDEAIRMSFSVSSGESGLAPVKTVGFWSALRKSEAMAAEMVSSK